jgi:hypothetical protein
MMKSCKKVSANVINNNTITFLENKQKIKWYLIKQHSIKLNEQIKYFLKKKNIMKGCIKRVFSNTIKKVMIS